MYIRHPDARIEHRVLVLELVVTQPSKAVEVSSRQPDRDAARSKEPLAAGSPGDLGAPPRDKRTPPW